MLTLMPMLRFERSMSNSGSYNGGGTVLRIGSCSAGFGRTRTGSLPASLGKNRPLVKSKYQALSGRQRNFIHEAAAAVFHKTPVAIPEGLRAEIEKHGSIGKWIAADVVRLCTYSSTLKQFAAGPKPSRRKQKRSAPQA